ncbi:MAG: biopolymer transporter Tol [Bacteroidota bacterium]|jgi:Tol biopolymer transport system component|nr:biopolymer transporter Tol [Bacteroidota bacterium]
MTRVNILSLLLFVFVPLLVPAGATAQYFGKNKVQYTDFDWYYIRSEHFDVYFSNDGYKLAEFTARAAEEALRGIQESFGYQITARIPFVIYNSHNDFQQTNVVGMYMEEGIGGVTEMFKNRVVVPFEGSYGQFRRVIHHELVHAVINDMFYGGSLQAAVTNRIRLVLPLWMNEGMAEYQALDGWDTNSDMFIRDAVTSNYLPPIPYLSGYFAYRGGQSVWWYIAEKYGRRKVGEVLNSIRGARSIDQGLKKSLGLTLEELSERWMKEQRRLYYPDVAVRESPSDYAKRLTDHTKVGAFYNTSPAISPSGDRIAFISNRDDYFSVYVMSAIDGSEVRKLIEGTNTNDFEELHLLTPGLSWSPDGRFIAMSSKSGADDAISVIDVESGDYEKLPVAKDGIYSVQWSPDGKSIAYVGNTAIQSDIWVYDFASKTTRNLTDDVFSDAQPSWSPDSRHIYFTSDRKDIVDGSTLPENFDMFAHDFSQMDIYRVDIETGIIDRITDTPTAEESYPIMGPDGRLLFIADRNGINNLHVREMESGTEYPVTNSLSGIYQISMTADGSKLAFASMFEAGFDIFLLRSPFERERIENLPPTVFLERRMKEAAARVADGQETVGEDDTTAHRAQVPAAETVDHSDDVVIAIGAQSNAVERDSTAAPPASGKRMLFANDVDVKSRDGSERPFAVRNNQAEDGSFIVNKYKLSFTADLVYGNAGYSTFYGVLGTTQMAFSDMLGDHQILFLTNLIGDLKNSDYALAYSYLPGRIDWTVQGFHSARFLFQYTGGFYEDLVRYRQYGFGLTASYPIDKFNRIDGSLTWMNVSQENLDNPMVPSSGVSLVVPNIGYVHDNTLWGMWSPVRGSRSEIRLFGSPGLGSTSLSFASLTFDYRKYYRFWTDFSMVLRGSGGGSFGANPQRFFLGGTENWINRTFENGRIPIDSEEDFAFLSAALPLRGYNYNARLSTRYLLGNYEIRFPLVKYFLGGVLPYILQAVNGAIFLDVGAVFDDVRSFKAFTRDENDEIMNQDLLIGTGIGARMWFLGFPLKFDIGWSYDGKGFSEPVYYFSLGADF